MTLTGKTRYRAKRRLLRKPLLVLQVEEANSAPNRFGDLERWTWWRDASVEDLTMMNKAAAA